MKLSNQNIYNLRGCNNFGGRCQMPLGGANHFCAPHRTPPRKSVPVDHMYPHILYNLAFPINIQYVKCKIILPNNYILGAVVFLM